MEFTVKNQGENKVTYDGSEILEQHSCVSRYEYKVTKNPFEHNIISWYWIKALEINNSNLSSLKVQMNLNNIILDENQSDKTANTNDEIVFNSNEINVLNSNFRTLQWMLIPSNLSGLLSSFSECFLPPHNLGFHSLRKIDSTFNIFDNSNISELFKLLPAFEDVFRKSFSPKTEENNLSLTSSSTGKLNFCDKEKLQDTSFELVDVSKLTNRSENRERNSSFAPNFKSRSFKSYDNSVDLIKIYKHKCFPTKRFTNAFKKPRKTSMNTICNVFTKNRQFSAKALYPNYNSSKRFYFANHKADNRFSCNITENDDEYCSGIQENFKEKFGGKQVTSKIAEIRQKVENLTRGMNNELNRREQHHLHFIKECKRICDSTVSFHDYNEIYNSKSFQNQCSDEDNSSDDELLSSCYQVHPRMETLHFTQDLKHNSTFSCFQDLDSLKVSNFPDHYRNRNASTKFRKQSKVLVPKYSNYLGKVFGKCFHHIVVVLDIISVPFVALLFGKK